MSVRVRIPTPLRRLTKGQHEVLANGATIGDVLADLEASYPGIKSRICDDQGDVRRFVNIFLNDEDIRFMDKMETELNDGDVLAILPALAGGC